MKGNLVSISPETYANSPYLPYRPDVRDYFHSGTVLKFNSHYSCFLFSCSTIKQLEGRLAQSSLHKESKRTERKVLLKASVNAGSAL